MTSRRFYYGYIAQLDLPGGPIKVGRSCQPLARLEAFQNATPVECRMIGVTLHGDEREELMLAATDSAKIRSEWRYVTPELRRLVQGWFEAGEWFVPVDDPKRHFKQADVERRIREYCDYKYSISHCSHRYGFAQHILKASAEKDPTLGLDWVGFVRAKTPPSFEWPEAKRQAA